MSEIAGRWFRVSTGGQDEVNQEPDVNRHIAQHGYTEGPTYRLHGESASKGEQDPYVAQVIADAKAGKLTVLVAWHVDRLDRRGAWATGVMVKALNDAGVRVETTDGGEVSDRDLNGLVKQWNAREESEHKAKRILASQAHKRSIGSWFSGHAPFGYDIVKLPDGRKTLKPNADAPITKRVFQMTADGLSYGTIIRAFKAEGIKAPGGKCVWQEASIGQMIRNRTFRGIVDYQGKPYMTVEAIVSADLWQRANQDLKTRASSIGYARRGSGRPSPAFLKPRCGRCGAPMYVYNLIYRCAGFPGARRCGNGTRADANTIKVAQLDAEINAYFLDDDEVEYAETVIAGTDYAEEIAVVQLAIKDLDLDADDYDDEHTRLRAELKRLRSLPTVPATRTEVPTGRYNGDVFEAMNADERRAYAAGWTLTVYPATSDDPNAITASLQGRRWMIYRPGQLSPDEVSESQAAMLRALKA